MLLVIITPKTIKLFQDSLSASLAKIGADEAEMEQVIERATKAFKAVALAYPLKPKILPASGVDVAKTINRIRNGKGVKESILALAKDASPLFQTHDIVVPEMDDKNEITLAEQKTARGALPPSPQRKTQRPALKIVIDDVFDAAKAEYARTNRRPDTAVGEISEGVLQGTRWGTIYVHLKNSNGKIRQEGILSLSKIFDVAMMGRKGNPPSVIKAHLAFEEIFENAADHIRAKPSRTTVLPYVFRMVEQSIVETMAKTGSIIDEATIIQNGPLKGMEMPVEKLNNLFVKASAKNPYFPYRTLYSFISLQEIPQKAAAWQANPGHNL